MEPIKDLADLRPTLDSLEKKRLIQYLTPPGRGCVVTHTLYLDREMDKVHREAGSLAQPDPPSESMPPPRVVAPSPTPQSPTVVRTAPPAASSR